MTTRNAYPIPGAALDDRLAWTGISGSGKTYNCGTAVERLLKAKSRVCIVDPLGVWWGLRLTPDGKPSSFKIVIFGGPRGDIAISESSGRVIGEAVAQMAESCIVDLSEFDTEASQRRFMLAFVQGAYARLTGDGLLHLILDEADMWAPQTIKDKEGDATKLHHHLQKIVRRGRVKGFIPWLITQRPAEISKSVLSMCGGIVAGNLISPQDVDALMEWVGKRADKTTSEMIRTGLPAFGQGEAVVYIPARRILQVGRFPSKATFDSSKAPERGEARSAIELKPLDLGALRTRLSKVEAETKANDPTALKARIAELERAARVPMGAPGASAGEVAAAEAHAEQRGYDRGYEAAAKTTATETRIFMGELRGACDRFEKRIDDRWFYRDEGSTEGYLPDPRAPVPPSAASRPAPRAPAPPAARANGHAPRAAAAPPPDKVNGGDISAPRQRILDALAWLATIDADAPDKTTLAHFVGVSPSSGGYFNNLGALRGAGLIDYPRPGAVSLTPDGRSLAVAPEKPPTHEAIMSLVAGRLPAPMMRVLKAAVASYPGAVGKDALAETIGVSPTSGGYFNNLGRLRSMGLLNYPAAGEVRAADILFPGARCA